MTLFQSDERCARVQANTKSQRSEQKDLTRENILNAATKLLGQQGFAALRVAAVAEEAGVSLGGYLHHFPSKDSLVAAVFERLSAHVLTRAMQDSSDAREESNPLLKIAHCAERFYAAPEFLIILDISLSVRRHTLLGDAVTKQLISNRAATERLWTPLLTTQGIPEAKALATVRALWGLARGLAISNAGEEAKPANRATIDLVISSLQRTLKDEPLGG